MQTIRKYIERFRILKQLDPPIPLWVITYNLNSVIDMNVPMKFLNIYMTMSGHSCSESCYVIESRKSHLNIYTDLTEIFQ